MLDELDPGKPADARWNNISGIVDMKAVGYLRGKGYAISHDRDILRPSPRHTPTEPELSAIRWLTARYGYSYDPRLASRGSMLTREPKR